MRVSLSKITNCVWSNIFQKDDSIAKFLDKLNYDAVLVPLIEFDSAIKASHKNEEPRSDTGMLCGEMINALEKKSTDLNTAIALPGFWKAFGGFEQYTMLQAVENRISRSLVMLSSCRAYSWVFFIATNATIAPSDGQLLWFHMLGRDVERHFNHTMTVNAPKEVTFNSEQYLPLLLPPRQVSVKLPRWTFDDQRRNLQTVQAIGSIIEGWLEFPANHQKISSALITILTKRMPLSVLLLDEVWMMYLKPYPVVIHGKPKQRFNDRHTEETLVKFEKAVENHDLAKPESQESLMLAALEKQAEYWIQLITMKGSKTVQEATSLLPGVSGIAHYSSSNFFNLKLSRRIWM